MTKRVIGLMLIVVGLALAYLIAKQTVEFLSPYVWQPSQCLIQRSEVLYGAQTDLKCRHALEYRYEVAGVQKTGRAWRLDDGVPPELCSEWASFAGKFPPGATQSCHVDPQNPDRVVLDRGNVFSIFKLILPAVLVIAGMAILASRGPLVPSQAIVLRIVQFVALGIVLAGAVAGVTTGIVPLAESFDSRDWKKSQCEVLSSGLRTTGTGSSPGSATRNKGYYINIVYTYAVNGRSFVSDRYDFDSFGSGRGDELREITDKYPAGAKVACAVNAANPYEAVLVPGMALKYLFGLIFFLGLPIGAGLWLTARGYL